jgi:putative transposase
VALSNRDTTFTRSFDAIFSAVGVEILKTPIRSPKANSYAERFVRTTRAESLDHVLIVGRRHLERVLAEFVVHYDTARPHRGLELATPVPRVTEPAPSSGILRRRDVLGGIIHEYEWAA